MKIFSNFSNVSGSRTKLANGANPVPVETSKGVYQVKEHQLTKVPVDFCRIKTESPFTIFANVRLVVHRVL